MIEIKVGAGTANVVVHDTGDFLLEATLVVKALVGAVAEKEECNEKVAFDALMMTSKITMATFDAKKTIIKMPHIKEGENNADD